MYIQSDITVDLTSVDVFNFAIDATQKIFQSPLPTVQGFTRSGKPTEVLTTDPQLAITYAIAYTYRLERMGQNVGTPSVRTFCMQQFDVKVLHHLFVEDTAPTSSKLEIEAAFAKYDVNSGENPYVYAAKHLSATIAPTMFQVHASYELIKGQYVEDDTQLQLFLDTLKSGTGVGKLGKDVDPEERGIGDYCEGIGLTATKISTTYEQFPNPPKTDPVHQVVVQDPTDPKFLDDVLADDYGDTDCASNHEMLHVRVATLGSIPEWKLAIIIVTVSVGPCGGIKIRIPLPVVCTRLCPLVLWAYVGVPVNEPNIKAAAEDCAKRAAILGAVIGIVTVNFVAGLAAFKGGFEECMRQKGIDYVNCLAPGLATAKEDAPWTILFSNAPC